jgi:hypothetical protein
VTLRALDAQARGMPRDTLIEQLFAQAEATVVLDLADPRRARRRICQGSLDNSSKSLCTPSKKHHQPRPSP